MRLVQGLLKEMATQQLPLPGWRLAAAAQDRSSKQTIPGLPSRAPDAEANPEPMIKESLTSVTMQN